MSLPMSDTVYATGWSPVDQYGWVRVPDRPPPTGGQMNVCPYDDEPGRRKSRVSTRCQIASVTAPEARLLVIQPWDRSVIPQIERAILQSDLGLSSAADGAVLRLPIPSLTEERRRDLARLVRGKVEEEREGGWSVRFWQIGSGGDGEDIWFNCIQFHSTADKEGIALSLFTRSGRTFSR